VRTLPVVSYGSPAVAQSLTPKSQLGIDCYFNCLLLLITRTPDTFSPAVPLLGGSVQLIMAQTSLNIMSIIPRISHPLRPPRSSTLNSFTTALFALALFAPLTSAQIGVILDPSKLPACALTCPILIQSQQICTPPIVNGDQGTYQTCFCNTAALAPFRAGQTTGVCDGICNAGELTQTQQWFHNLCSGGVAVIPNGGATAAANAPTTTTTAGSTATGGLSNASTLQNGKGPSW